MPSADKTKPVFCLTGHQAAVHAHATLPAGLGCSAGWGSCCCLNAGSFGVLAGVQYVVALWASDLKDALGYSQGQLQALISPPFVVALIGCLPGLTYDALARRSRLGPRSVRR